MKKVTLLLIVAVLLFTQTALAETATTYETFVPVCVNIDGTDPVIEYMLRSTLYVSENEIWFSGTSDEVGPWMIKTNTQGDILAQYILEVQPDESVTNQCVSKASSGLLVGIRDGRTLLGRVGLFTNDGQIRYTSLGDVEIFAYAPAPNGMLAQGILFDESRNTCATQTTLVDQNGQIVFQTTGNFCDTEVNMAALTSSLCCASDDDIFVQETRGIPSSILSTRELVCMDLTGQDKWRVPLDADVVPYAISAADGNVYLFGCSCTWDEEDVLTIQKAMVLCFSSEGTCQWTRIFESPAIFQRGNAGLGVCVAAGEENGEWYISIIGADGIIRKMVRIDAEAQHINKPYIVSNGMIKLLGISNEHLLICDIPF